MRWLLGVLFAFSLAASDSLIAGALVGAGDRLLEQGKKDEATRLFRAATEIAPDSGFAWYRLGMAYQSKGQRTEKLEAFRRARQADPDNTAIARVFAEALAWQMPVVIHGDCWGNGGPCGPGELGFTLSGRDPLIPIIVVDAREQ